MTKKKQGSNIKGYPYSSDIDHLAEKLTLNTGEVHFLRILHSMMNKEKTHCWPSQKTIAKKLRCNERTVRRYGKTLESKGIISVTKKKSQRKHGSNNYNEYRMNFPWNFNESQQTRTAKLSGLTPETDRTICPSRPDNKYSVDRTICAEQTGHNDRLIVNGSSQENSQKNSSSSSGEEDDRGSKISDSIDSSQRKEDIKKATDDWPNEASEEELKKFYEIAEGRSRVPKAVDLTEGGLKKVNLSRYVSTFGKNNVNPNLGKKYDTECHPDFERQLVEFIEDALGRHWSKNSKPPGYGFKLNFIRAGRAGALHRLGFRPKNPEQVEAERLEAKRLEQERRKMKAKREAERQEEEEKKRIEEEKICAVFDIIRSFKVVEQFLILTGFDHVIDNFGGAIFCLYEERRIVDYLEKIAAELSMKYDREVGIDDMIAYCEAKCEYPESIHKIEPAISYRKKDSKMSAWGRSYF